MTNLDKQIQRAKAGIESACRDIYEEFMPYCYGICLRYGVPKHDVKDILQITFSSIFTSIDAFDSQKSSFKTWISRITINKILDYRKKYSKHNSSVSLTEAYSAFSKEVNQQNIDRDYVFQILASMPTQYQDVFNLFIIDGYSHKEIADKLDITEISSRSKLMRGREWAKTVLSHHLITSETYG